MGTPWHQDDQLWRDFAAAMFSPAQIELAEREAGEIMQLLGLAPGACVLDMPCGIGRHSVALAKMGMAVTGVDRTKHYLERAAARARSAGVSVEWVEADMREFRRPHPHGFDVALNLYTSLGYFDSPEEDVGVLRNLHASLKPGGRLVVEMMGREIAARVFREREWQRGEDGSFHLREARPTHDWTRIENRFVTTDSAGTREHTFSHWIYTGEQVREMVKGAGFVDVQVLGSLGGIPYDHNALRLVVSARV